MSRRPRSVEDCVRALPLICATLLLGTLPALPARTACAASETAEVAKANQVIELNVRGSNGPHFEAVVRELLARIDVDVGSANKSSSPAVLFVEVHLDGTRGGFVARRELDGAVIARSEVSFESEDLLREAIAHTLLSLVDAVKQGQPVPSDLQGSETPLPEADVTSNAQAVKPPPPAPTTSTPQRTPASSRPTKAAPLQRWQVGVGGSAGLLDETHPLLGATLRGERRIDAQWAAGAALNFGFAPQFHAEGFLLQLTRQGLDGYVTWRALTQGQTSVLLVPFIGVNREVAEALQGNGALSGPQSKWLLGLGVRARARHVVRGFSIDAELGVRAFPTAPRLFVTDGNTELTLLEPWSVQPELGLVFGALF